jgi:hypothetical protein
MLKNAKQLIGSLVFLLIFIISTTQAGATMNTLTATRLGKVDAGEQANGKKNLAAPIVLWGKDATGSALYISSKTTSMTGSGEMAIDYLESPAKSLKNRLKKLTGAYPITDSVHGIFTEEDAKKIGGVDEIYTKDINGDGVDELILTRGDGGIVVYDREKLLFKYKPKSNPKLYTYKMKDINFTNLGDHDEIFFTRHQDPDDNEKRNSRDTWIVRVNPSGITEIHPVFPDHSEPESIETVIGLNRPGSRVVDELVVISEIKDKKGTYLSRHKLDGTGIDAPREIYTGYGSTCSAFGFSGSNQIIFNNAQQKMLYFVTPDKPVNWIKTIDQKKLFGEDTKARIIGEKVINNIAVLVLEDHGKLYALDALGKFHTSMKPDSHISNTPVPFMTLKPDSNKHEIIKIQPADKTMESYLIIQSRDPGRRELSLEELEKAGKRFLTDHDWKMCKEELRLNYYDTTPELAGIYCRDHKIPMPEIHSWEDIKKKIPGFYEQKIGETQNSYINAIATRLLRPIEREGYNLEDKDYKNIAEYRKWLSSVYVMPELVVSIQHISKGNIGHQRLTDYYFKDLAYGNGERIPSINARTNGEHGRAFMVLHKRGADIKDIKPAYYTIAW